MSEAGFAYSRAADVDDALLKGARPGAAFLAGGTDLMQLWKASIQTPVEVVDISRLPPREVTVVDGALSIGALAKMSDVARDVRVARDFPLIADAILGSASGQVRNMATLGGNLLQRTRCPYFRTAGLACNKRVPRSGCGALAGENRGAALFGTSQACVASHPSDLAVALAALDAEVEVLGASGQRRLQLPELYRLPGETPERDTTLAPGELITSVHVRDALGFAPRSTYLKIRDRASFEFAVVAMAAALRLDNGIIVEARLAAGGVAPRPWRLDRAEQALLGRTADARAFADAADLAVQGARPLEHNGFKVELLRRAVIRALTMIGSET